MPSTDRTDPRKRRLASRARWYALLAVLAVSTAIGIVHQKAPELRVASVDALCPFGGLEAAWSLLSGGPFLQRLAWSSVVLLIAAAAVALVFGRSFCGTVCPLGTLQEIFGRLGRKLFRRRREMPAALDRPARFLKYGVLAVFTVWTWRVGETVMRPYDPWATFHHLTSAELLTEFGVGLAILGVTVGGSLVYDRFFCKYACPMGALLGILSPLRRFAVRRDSAACIDCGACDTACPVNLKPASAETVSASECLMCSECVNACPAKGALEVRSKTGRRVTPLGVTSATLGVFAALVAVSMAAGYFDWVQPSLAEQLDRSGGTVTGGEHGTDSPIKGYMSMREVAEASGIPAAEFRARFGVSEADMDRPLKEAKDGYDWTVEDVRAFVNERTGTQ